MLTKVNRVVLVAEIKEAFEKFNTSDKYKAKGNFFTFHVVDTLTEICVYSTAGIGFPVRICPDGEPWTFRGECYRLNNQREYVKLIRDAIYKHSLNMSTKHTAPPDADIDKTFDRVNKKEIDLPEDISLEDYRHFIRYLYFTLQTCTVCKVGVIKVDVGSHYETHECTNCHKVEQIC